MKRKASTPVEVGRSVKTTGVCPHLKYEAMLSLSDRELACPSFNSTFEGDVASAIAILKEGLSLWNVGETPGDENASVMRDGIPAVFQA